jgi:hypothetical protein
MDNSINHWNIWATQWVLNSGLCLWGIPIRIHITFVIWCFANVAIMALGLTRLPYIVFVCLLNGPLYLGTLIIVRAR